MVSTHSIECPEEIPEAAKILDRINPGWANAIDLFDLKMVCPDNCILGQLYGNAEESPFIPPYQWIRSAFGYSDEHHEQWVKEIQNRVYGDVVAS